MVQEYKVVSLDSLVSGEIPPAYRDDPAIARALRHVRYKPLLRHWRQERHDRLFALSDDYNRRLADLFWEMAHQSHAIAPCGELQFDRIWCAGCDGMRVDLEHGVAYFGHVINWSRDYFNWALETSGIGFQEWVGDDAFLADFGKPQRRDDNIVMMKSPGHGIFGHWLLDFAPQLEITRFMDLPVESTYVFDHLSEWMRTLLDAIGISRVDAYQNRLTEHTNMRSPTGLKNGYAMGQPINGLAWNKLRAHFNHRNCHREPSADSLLFISRRKWVGPRGLTKYKALEALMTRLGFRVYYPEQHSLADQAHVFSSARVVLGEDGSALHSIMFTDPGAVLGVLMQEDRCNLWHAGICEAMGHSLAYMEIRLENGEPRVDLAKAEEFARQLLALR